MCDCETADSAVLPWGVPIVRVDRVYLERQPPTAYGMEVWICMDCGKRYLKHEIPGCFVPEQLTESLAIVLTRLAIIAHKGKGE